VGRNQHQPGTGTHRLECAEDRRMPDRMRHDSGVELRIAGGVDLAAAALMAAAPALRRGGVSVSASTLCGAFGMIR
jgi:hypothetical protein